MTGKVAEIQDLLSPNGLARNISQLWDTWYTQRSGWTAEKSELRNFIFATDTSSTSAGELPWKNKTTLPKLCQIRDNLHANYMSALFPNDNWFKWEAFTLDAALVEKKEAIQAYISNKVRESGFRETISLLLYDYIDYGNAFGEVIWVNESKEDPETGEQIPGYIGPKLLRISPLDMIFNLTAPTFASAPKITRYIKGLGELMTEIEDYNLDPEVVAKIEKVRKTIGGYKREDVDKATGYSVDGFGNLQDYYQSGFVEILKFEGDIFSDQTGELLRDQEIWVVDRAEIVKQEVVANWLGKSNKVHVGWRDRQDNLLAMGPLDNLVGMQYRIDHTENSKSDAVDQYILPPKIIKGEVEPFEWGPDCEIHLDENGDVEIFRPDLSSIFAAENQIQTYMNMMEEFAGAPKQAMGIRTPGEKTAFEVSSLDNASGRIFQDKTTKFEVLFVERVLNLFLETARRNMDGVDVVRTIDNDLGVTRFFEITKEDITASGLLRPIGARHFAAQAQLVQNLTGLANSAIWPQIQAHMSDKRLAELVEEVLQLDRFSLISDNIKLFEQADTRRLQNQIEEDLLTEQQTPLPEELALEEELIPEEPDEAQFEEVQP